MRQIPLAMGLEAPQTFDNFQALGANQAALDHLRSLESGSPPVTLWGPPGSGKSHLLRALAHAVQARGDQVGWFHPGQSLPWEYDEQWSLLVLDDCERYDADQQHAAFSAFVQAVTLGAQVVAAAALPPIDLPLRDDLRTRLGWGHIFALQPLGETEVRATLRRAADYRGIFLSDEVMSYLLTRFERNLSHLMQLLDRLDEFALAKHRAVTVPLLKEMLSEAPLANTNPNPNRLPT